MTTTLVSIIGSVIALIGIVARVLIYLQGRRNRGSEYEADKSKRLSNRPRTTADVTLRLREWRSKIKS